MSYTLHPSTRRGPRPQANQNPNQHQFRALLDVLRSRAGLSQNDLARAVGVSPAHVNRVLRGLPPEAPTQCSRTITLKIAEVLELDQHQTDELLWLAGHAPITNYQALYLRLTASLEDLRGLLDAQSSEPASSSVTGGSTGRVL